MGAVVRTYVLVLATGAITVATEEVRRGEPIPSPGVTQARRALPSGSGLCSQKASAQVSPGDGNPLKAPPCAAVSLPVSAVCPVPNAASCTAGDAGRPIGLDALDFAPKQSPPASSRLI